MIVIGRSLCGSNRIRSLVSKRKSAHVHQTSITLIAPLSLLYHYFLSFPFYCQQRVRQRYRQLPRRRVSLNLDFSSSRIPIIIAGVLVSTIAIAIISKQKCNEHGFNSKHPVTYFAEATSNAFLFSIHNQRRHSNQRRHTKSSSIQRTFSRSSGNRYIEEKRRIIPFHTTAMVPKEYVIDSGGKNATESKCVSVFHNHENDNADKDYEWTDRSGNVRPSNVGSPDIGTAMNINVSLVCETKLDYVGAGTLGDIMSYPSEEKLSIVADEVDIASTSSSSSISASSDAVVSSVNQRKYLSANSKILNSSITTTNINSRNQTENEVSMIATKKTRISETNISTPIESQIQSYNERSPTKSGLVTKTGGTLCSQFKSKIPNLSPLDRIALTANGNLQRIFSSYYDAPVHVFVDRCERRSGHDQSKCRDLEDFSGLKNEVLDMEICDNLDSTDEYRISNCAVWDRTVYLSVHNQNFCKATSVITVHSKKCIRLVQSEEVGIGQLFRYLDKLPSFALQDAGRTTDGGLWRRYELCCKELSCDILEEFSPSAWRIAPPDSSLDDSLDDFNANF